MARLALPLMHPLPGSISNFRASYYDLRSSSTAGFLDSLISTYIVILCCVCASNNATGQLLPGQEVRWHEFDCAWSSLRPSVRNVALSVQLAPPMLWSQVGVSSATVPMDPADLRRCYRHAQRFHRVSEQAIIHRYY